MKVLFAIGNAQTSKSVADKYFQMYGEKLDYKDVFYFRALLEEVKKDKTYDRIVISEELEPIKAVTIEEIDQAIFSNIDNLTDEVQDASIAFIGSDRRTKVDPLVSRLFNIGVYSLLLGADRNISSLCDAIREPRTKKDAKEYLNLNPATNTAGGIQSSADDEITEGQMAHILKHYEKLGSDKSKYITSFESIEEQFNKGQLKIVAAAIDKYLPPEVADTIRQDPRYTALFPIKKKKISGQSNGDGKNVGKKSGILNFLSGKKSASNSVVTEGARIQAEEEERARIAAERAEAEAKKIREEAEAASRLQAEQLRKEKEERLAKAEQELKEKQEAEQKAKAEAERLAKEQEELRQRAIAEQKAKAEAERFEKEQEMLRQKGLEQQKAKEIENLKAIENITNEAKPTVEIDISALQNKNSEKKEAVSQDNGNKAINSEVEIDISALQNKTTLQSSAGQVDDQEMLKQKALAEQRVKAEAEKQAREQEALRQKALAEQRAKEEAERQAKEQEALRQKALAEQKAKAEAERQAKEQEALRQKALAEQRTKAEVERQTKEQEALRQKALAEQRAREEAERLAKEQDELRKRVEAERAAVEAMDNTTVNVTTPTQNSALISQPGDDYSLESNFSTATYQLPSDYKKVIALVGTSKVGTTFLANAIACSASEKGIKTALLDMTKSKGVYYLYNKSDSKKIQIAAECIKNLNEGRNTPIPVDKNRNLLVYTSLPGLGENRKNYKHKTIIDTIKKTCNLLIIDCDFTTPIEYFEQASEVYIVQDMDLIKLQETTAFLREFKNRNIEWSKLSVIVNKYVKSSFTPKKIVEVGLAYYNDPQMTYTEEFEIIKSYITVPFTVEDYVRYTEDIAKDKIVYKNYSVQLRSAIEQICRRAYPSGDSGKRKGLFK